MVGVHRVRGTIHQHKGNGPAAGSTVHVVRGRQAGGDRRHRSHQIGRLEGQSQCHLAAVGDTRGEHRARIRACLLNIAFNQLAHETHIVYLQPVCRIGTGPAAAVVVRLISLRIEHNKAVLLGELLEGIAVHRAALRGAAARPVKYQHQRRLCAHIPGCVYPVAAGVSLPCECVMGVISRQGGLIGKLQIKKVDQQG